jgi:thymidine kinase
MFAGKTSYLMNHPASICFKPVIDTRTDLDVVRTHDGHERLAVPVAYAGDLDKMIPDGIMTVCIDEAQFFGPEIIPAVVRMSREGLYVIVAGLDLDAKGEPFGAMPGLLAVADTVTKLRTKCVKCARNRASRSYRKVPLTGQIVIGGAESYEPRCLSCWSA